MPPGPGLHAELDGATLDVTAFACDGAWRFRVDVYEREAGGTIHTEAVGGILFPSEAFALAQGMSYARWLVGEQDEGSRAATIDESTEVRRSGP